ncbi:MAG: SocA family protein [Muribaculaceae bacterium]|nr:SocA family protein [Muribaculaceae bacterium]
MSLGITVNKDKNGMLLAYLTNNMPDIHLRKLLKIIYLIDEHFMKLRGFPLTWFDYYAWAKGPVAPEVYEIKNGAFSEFVSSHRFKDNKCVINSLCDASEVTMNMKSIFSELEVVEIDKLIGMYRSYTADELSDLTHVKDSIWSKVVADNHLVFDVNNRRSDCLIDLKMLFTDQDWRIEIYGDARWDLEFQAKLLSDRNPNHKIQLRVVSPTEREQYRIPAYSPAIP